MKKIVLFVATIMIVLSICGCGKEVDYSSFFTMGEVGVYEENGKSDICAEFSINNSSKKNNLTYYVTINDKTMEYKVNSGECFKEKVIIIPNESSPEETQVRTNFTVKKKDNVLWSSDDVITVKDFKEYFEFGDPFFRADDFIIPYKVTNLGYKNGVRFKVCINGEEKEYDIETDETVSDNVTISLPHPDTFDLCFPYSYEVIKEDKVIWKKTSEIEYDCTDHFIHEVTVRYKGVEKKITVEDYELNYFDLESLFPSFDINTTHKVTLAKSGLDIAGFVLDDNSTSIKTKFSNDKWLLLCTKGTSEYADSGHFSNDQIIDISDCIMAKDVNWEEYMTFPSNVEYETSYIWGEKITVFKMSVYVDNVSEERIKVSSTAFYVENKAVAANWFNGCHTTASAGEKVEIYEHSTPEEWKSTGVSSVKKFGMGIKIEDQSGNVVYEGIVWMHL